MWVVSSAEFSGINVWTTFRRNRYLVFTNSLEYLEQFHLEHDKTQ